MDCIKRAARLFERLTVLVSDHPHKQGLFGTEQRLAVLSECVREESLEKRVTVARHAGLVVDACAELGGDVIVRGARSGADFDYEAMMASTNRSMAPEIDTLLLVTDPALAHTSSTLVRQISRLGGDVSGMVPGPVLRALQGLS